MSDESRTAAVLHALGKKCLDAGFYPEAEWYFRYAVYEAGDDHEHASIFKLDLANSLQMVRRYYESGAIYEQFASSSNQEQYKALANSELTKLQERRQQWAIPVDGRLLTADDQQLLNITSPMLPKYPAIARRIHMTWVDDSRESLLRIREMQKQQGDPQRFWLQSLDGCEALALIIGSSHWVLVKNRWKKAKESALCGLLSHELAHVEIKDTFRGYVVDDESDIGFICNERATDLLAIAKGFGPELLESRKFMERTIGSLDQHPSLMTPKEITRILNGGGSRWRLQRP